jgi:hypothetical protein
MKFKRVVWLVFFVLVSEIFLVSSMSSENYGIVSPTVGDGGEKNLTSINYGLGAIIGGISGLMNSATQVLRIGFWHTAKVDRESPVVVILNPVNNSNFNVPSVAFNVSADKTLSWCGLSVNDGVNITMTLNGTSTGGGYVNSSMPDGNYNFVVYCNDSVGNVGVSDRNYFLVDTISPQISFVSPTPGDREVIGEDSVFVNVSSSDANYVSTFIDWDNSLVSWWRMDDLNATGGVVDYMGRNNGTVHGNARQTDAGKIGKAFEFDGGADDYVSFAGVPDIANLPQYTISAWIYSSIDTGNVQTFVGFGNTTTTTPIIHLGIQITTGNAVFQHRDDSNTLSSIIDTKINDGNWYLVTGVRYAPNDHRLFINGIQVASSSTSIGTTTIDTFNIGILQRTSYGYPFSGSIDQVMIFNKSLSSDEVYQLYVSNLYKYNRTQWHLEMNYTEARTIQRLNIPQAKKFEIKNATDSTVASIDSVGNMYIRGTAFQSQSVLNPTANSFVVQNNAGTTIAYVNATGSLFLKGVLSTYSDLFGRTTSNLEVRNEADSTVAFFDNQGNLKLKGGLAQNYANP